MKNHRKDNSSDSPRYVLGVSAACQLKRAKARERRRHVRLPALSSAVFRRTTTSVHVMCESASPGVQDPRPSIDVTPTHKKTITRESLTLSDLVVLVDDDPEPPVSENPPDQLCAPMCGSQVQNRRPKHLQEPFTRSARDSEVGETVKQNNNNTCRPCCKLEDPRVRGPEES